MFDSEYSFFLILIIGIAIFIFLNFIFKCVKEKEKKEEDEKRTARIRAEVEEERNRPKDAPLTTRQIISKAVDLSKDAFEGNEGSRDIILTSDNRLVFKARNRSSVLIKKLDDLLQIKLDIQIREKNVMKVISILPTYDKHTMVEKISLKFIFANSTEEIFIIPEYKNITNPIIQYDIDEMERFKLVVENEVEKFKNAKSKNNSDVKKDESDDISKISNALKELQSLKEQEILTEEEFNKKKKVLLEKIK
ncbi:SHOCT domain-containing protein [Clostridioides difficile]